MMKIGSSSVSTQLLGDWTIAGIAGQTKPLAELSSRCYGITQNITIDCSGIEHIDLSGFQLIYVWKHCLHINGIKPKFVNVPGVVLESQRRLGLGLLFDSQDNRL